MSKERRDAHVNGTTYHIVIVDTDRRKRVSIYPPEISKYNRTRKKNAHLVYDRRWRGRVLWFGKDTTDSIEQIVKEALNKAVCIYEEKQEKQENYEERMESVIEQVAEIHEE